MPQPAITPNEVEAGRISGVGELLTDVQARQAGVRLVEWGVGAACVKLNRGGCVLVSRDGAHRMPAPRVHRVDATGADDAFAGALAVALAEGRELRAAAHFAGVASALAVQAYGSSPAYPERKELDEAVRRHATGAQPGLNP